MSAVLQLVADASSWSGRARYPNRATWVGVRHDRADPATLQVNGTKGERAGGGLLAHVVEAEILPRLALTRSAAANLSVSDLRGPAVMTTESDTSELLRLVLKCEASEAVAFVSTLTLRGVTAETLFLGVITEAARALGALWEEDRCDLVQVAIGTGRLQQVMRALTPDFQRDGVRRRQPDSVLLLPAPGEMHTFGLSILGEFFRRSGWHVGGGPASGNDAAALVGGGWFDVVGFSIGSDVHLEGLSRCIRAVRRVSRNRDIGVMVGGPLFLVRPDLVSRVGADVAAADAPGAVRGAVALLAMRVSAA